PWRQSPPPGLVLRRRVAGFCTAVDTTGWSGRLAPDKTCTKLQLSTAATGVCGGVYQKTHYQYN
ncbi:hypothetical protein, partial [Paracoccus benzoatiresistens]